MNRPEDSANRKALDHRLAVLLAAALVAEIRREDADQPQPDTRKPRAA